MHERIRRIAREIGIDPDSLIINNPRSVGVGGNQPTEEGPTTVTIAGRNDHIEITSNMKDEEIAELLRNFI